MDAQHFQLTIGVCVTCGASFSVVISAANGGSLLHGSISESSA